MNTELDTPEPNESLVTYTYDDYDNLIYRNVYDGDRNSFSRRFGLYNDGFPVSNNTNFAPKKLLYQDVYTYNKTTGQRETRRVYQPIIEISGERPSTPTVNVWANIVCRSNVLASGFITSTDKEAFVGQFLYPVQRSLFSAGFKGKNATGYITQTFAETATLYIKAYAMIETGVLFSKTLTILAAD